jgi:hypothetical protein
MMGRSAEISLRAHSFAWEALKGGLSQDLSTNCSCWNCGGCPQSQNSVDHDGAPFIFGAAIVNLSLMRIPSAPSTVFHIQIIWVMQHRHP